MDVPSYDVSSRGVAANEPSAFDAFGIGGEMSLTCNDGDVLRYSPGESGSYITNVSPVSLRVSGVVDFPTVRKTGFGRPAMLFARSVGTSFDRATVSSEMSYPDGDQGKGYRVMFSIVLPSGSHVKFRWENLDSADGFAYIDITATDDYGGLGAVTTPREVLDPEVVDSNPIVEVGVSRNTFSWRGLQSVSDQWGLSGITMPDGVSYNPLSGVLTNESSSFRMLWINLYADGNGTWNVSSGGDGEVTSKRAVFGFPFEVGQSVFASFGTNQVPWDCYSAITFSYAGYSTRYSTGGIQG